MSIHLVLLVLTVASRVTLGSDEVLRGQLKIDNQQAQVTAETNSVITSTEMQGAASKAEKEATTRKIEVSTTTPQPETAKERVPSHSTDKRRPESSGSAKESLPENVEHGPSLVSPPTTMASSTTSRPTRQGISAQNRDSKLMSLLAARRSALQRNRFGSHRRAATTNRTTIETTLKTPSDPRTTCERNCTKNFTRRITASCMRRCVSMHKTLNATTAPTVRTKVDEKDNNEILFTDESSHGFFVVTKELNDTANHISDGLKPAASSAEKGNKIKTKLRPPLPIEGVDMRPYVYFGQKLPPLKPTALKITKVSDDHPKILEVFVTRPTERSKVRSRFNPRERNAASFNRRHGLANFTRQTVNASTNKPVFGAFKSNSEERLLRETASVDHSSLTLLTRSAQPESAKLQLSSENPLNFNDVAVTDGEKSLDFIPVTVILEEDSTPLIISVPELEDDTDQVPTEIPLSIVEAKIATAVEDVIVSSTETTISSSTVEATKAIISSPTTATTTSTTTITLPPSKETLTPSESSQLYSSTEAFAYSTPVPDVFTRTTISSSVRSTTNPRSTSIAPPSSTSTTPSNPPIEHTKKTQEDNISEELNTTSLTPLDFIAALPDQNFSGKDAERPEIEGVVLANNEVTMEMNRINTATYVLAGLGMFPVAIIILYVAKTVFLKRQSKVEDDLDNYITDQQPISPVRKMEHLEEEKSEQYSIISGFQEFDRKKLRFKSLLGEGNFGQVWKAEADDLSGHLGTTRIVAVKTVRTGSSQVGLQEEAEIMKKLGSHPNVVTLLGACIETEPHLLIMEYAMRGRLLSLLRAARSATNILPASVPGGRSLAPLSPRTLAGFALDIARGMEYIAEKKIVHRDLAARNVLLDHNGVCKICDFGMSLDLEATRKTQTPTRKADIIRTPSSLEHRLRLDIGARLTNHWNHINNNNCNNNHKKKQHDSISKRPALPIRWMAPEALQYHIFSTETDVWAFGIVLWEVATLGCTPYPNLSGREVVRCVPNGARPELPKDGRPEFYELMSQCWQKDPRQRPTFKEARVEISRTIYKWVDDDTANSDYMDVSGFSEDLEQGMVFFYIWSTLTEYMVYFNRRISEFECEI